MKGSAGVTCDIVTKPPVSIDRVDFFRVAVELLLEDVIDPVSVAIDALVALGIGPVTVSVESIDDHDILLEPEEEIVDLEQLLATDPIESFLLTKSMVRRAAEE